LLDSPSPGSEKTNISAQSARRREENMDQTHAIKPAPNETPTELVSQAQIRKMRFDRFRSRAWQGKITRARILTVAALLLLVLPIFMAVANRQDILSTVPLVDRIFSRPSSNVSSVLAVDVHEMTIRGKIISTVARGHIERAAVEQLAQLHHIYAGWVATDQDAVGTMLLRLHVDGAGKVAKIEPLRSRLSSSDFAKVVFEEIRQWNFPVGAAQPLEITMPLLFVPKGLDANTVVQWERRTRDSEAERKIAMLAQGSPTAAAGAVGPTSASAKSEGGHQLANANVKRAISPKAFLPIVKTTQAVALRQQPRFAAERVHEIDAETELNLLERKGDWLKVRLADARAVGFVRKEYLTPVN
jgi:hypothetical protein